MTASRAQFSADRVYRYKLWRQCGTLGGAGTCVFVCLNPSTADELLDDPTVRRCVDYAARWGYKDFVMLNLFGLRSTDPAALYTHPEPVGEHNDMWIAATCASAALVVAAWGEHGTLHGRGEAVLARLPKPHYLKLNKGGQPCHPLYLPKRLVPQPF